MSIDGEGLTWDLLLPLPASVETASGAKAGTSHMVETTTDAAHAVADVQHLLSLDGKRFLVVEDESLVAMDIVEALEESGATVLGPAGSADEAFALLSRNKSIDAVLLDANLHGRPSDAIADALMRAQVPFAFVTGYGRDGLPDVFATAPVLSKPFSRTELTKLATSLVAARAV
jgi:CheY-like chemotaxis protein